MSHHVIVTLPDGRVVRADYRQREIVRVLRRINEQTPLPISKRNHDQLARDDLTAAAWLDAHPELNCTAEQVRDGTCAHPPASSERYAPRPEQRRDAVT